MNSARQTNSVPASETHSAAQELRPAAREKSFLTVIVALAVAGAIFAPPPNRYSLSVFIVSFVLLLGGHLSFAQRLGSRFLSLFRNPGAVSARLVLLALLLSATLLATSFSQNALERTLASVASKRGEYLFFVGTTLLGLTLLAARRRVLAGISVALGLIWILFHRPTMNWMKSLGSDSLNEATNFDVAEAVFFLDTALNVLSPNYKALPSYLILASMLVLFFNWLRKRVVDAGGRVVVFKLVFSVALVVLGVQVTTQDIFALYMRNTGNLSDLKSNFSAPLPSVRLANDLTLVAYIGESISIMNMGLYGYPRQTTPVLSALVGDDPGILVFEDIFSTHTHTSQSLLEALSLGNGEDDGFLPISERKRTSLPDVLVNSGVDTVLISNQGQSGTWNLASSVLFQGARQQFSGNSRWYGNLEKHMEKPWDHDFLVVRLEEELRQEVDGKKAIFLHSYAGHGPYLDNIPEEFRDPVDERYLAKNKKGIAGPVESVDAIEEYDSAIKYVDYALSRNIAVVKNAPRPVVFLYFSDHGDAVYPDRGHDSSRFTHEMARVPFVIYFNESARITYPDLFAKYRALASTSNPSTLAQLSATVLDLFGAVVDVGEGQTKLERLAVVGEKTRHPPIIVRETTEGITYVDINKVPLTPPQALGKTFLDKTDDATKSFVISTDGASETTICYHRSNAFGKALRGRLVADCLEVDLVVEPNGELAIYHPPAEDTGLRLSEIVEVAAKNGLALWIDGKNLHESGTCNRLFDHLEGSRLDKPILVEFPSGDYGNKSEVAQCAEKMQGAGFFTSYYVPTKMAVACSKSLQEGNAFGSDSDCLGLEADLGRAFKSGLFTDFSFDYRAVNVLENIPFADGLRWNTWHVEPGTVGETELNRFRMVILNNSDPNSI